MRPEFRVKFAEEGQNLVARINIPSPNGPLTVKAEVPMIRIRQEVQRWMNARADSVGGDLGLLQSVPEITRRAAKRRLVRKLHDNVGFWPGGPKTESINALASKMLDDARGNDRVPRQVAERKIFIIMKEAQKGVPAASISLAALRRINKEKTKSQSSDSERTGKTMDIGDSMVGGLKSFLKKAGKTIGKGATKTADIATSNPIARSLVSTVPGGAAALAASDYGKNAVKIIKAAKSGNPKALEGLAELKREAAAGNPQAILALKSVSNVNTDMKKPRKPPSLYMRGVRAGVNPAIWGNA